jgi:hypothetical protein
VGLERIESIGRKDHRDAAGFEDPMNFANSRVIVGHVFEDFVDQRDVEVIVGKFDGLDVTDRDAPLG